MIYKLIRIDKARTALGFSCIFHLQSHENQLKSHENGRERCEKSCGVGIVVIGGEKIVSINF